MLGDGVIKMVRTTSKIHDDLVNHIIKVENELEKTRNQSKKHFDLKKRLSQLYDLADQLEKVF